MTSPEKSLLWPGVPLALASAFLFALTAPVAKILLGNTDPWVLAGVLYLGAGLGLLLFRAVLSVTGGLAAQPRLSRAQWPWLGAVIAFGGIAGPVLLMLGVTRIPASSASLLLNLEALATMTIAWLVFRENVERRLLLGAALILLGAVLLSWQGGGLVLQPGSLFVAAACLCWGIDNNLSRKIAEADPTQIAMLKGLVAGPVNLALAFWLGASLPPGGTALLGAVTGVFGIGFSLVLFLLALRHLGAARTGAYYSTAPFVGALVAILFLGESVTWQLLLAGLLMAAGLWLHLTERHEHEHEHEEVTHDHTHTHDIHHQHEHVPPVAGSHSHPHVHRQLRHRHAHYPDIHHRHEHGS